MRVLLSDSQDEPIEVRPPWPKPSLEEKIASYMRLKEELKGYL